MRKLLTTPQGQIFTVSPWADDTMANEKGQSDKQWSTKKIYRKLEND